MNTPGGRCLPVSSPPTRAEPARLRRIGLGCILGCLLLHSLGIFWALPSPYDASPDALPVLRTLYTVDSYLTGRAAADKYPQAHHLLVGTVQKLCSCVLLSSDEREGVDRLVDRFADRQRSGEASSFARDLLSEGHDLAGPLSRLVIVGRAVTIALMAVLLIALHSIVARCISPRVAPWSVLAVGLEPGFVHYAATVNVDVPYVAWFVLALHATLSAARGRRGSAALAGAFSGLSVATKDQAAGLLPGLLFLFLLRCRGRKSIGRGRALVAAAGGFIVVYALTSGALDVSAYREHLRFVFGEGLDPYRSGGLLTRLVDIPRMFWVAAGPVASLLVLMGLPSWLRLRRAAGLLLPPLLYLFVFVLPAGYVYPRFTLPLALVAAFSGGAFLSAILRRVRRRAPRWVAVLVIAAYVLAPLPQALEVVRLKWTDPRSKVAAELESQRGAEEKVALLLLPFLAAPAPLPRPPFHVLSGLEELLRRSEEFEWLIYAQHFPPGAPLRHPFAVGDVQNGFRVVRVFEPDRSSSFARHVEIQPLLVLLRRAE